MCPIDATTETGHVQGYLVNNTYSNLSYTLQTQQVYTKHLNIMRYHIDTSKEPYAPVRFSPYSIIKRPHSHTRVQYGTVRYRTVPVRHYTIMYGCTVRHRTITYRTVPYRTFKPTLPSIVHYNTVRYRTVRYCIGLGTYRILRPLRTSQLTVFQIISHVLPHRFLISSRYLISLYSTHVTIKTYTPHTCPVRVYFSHPKYTTYSLTIHQRPSRTS